MFVLEFSKDDAKYILSNTCDKAHTDDYAVKMSIIPSIRSLYPFRVKSNQLDCIVQTAES